MKITLITNPTASSVTPKLRDQIRVKLSESHDVKEFTTLKRGHATKIAQDAVVRKDDAVVTFSGDGTLNEVANGLAKSSTALGILPGGSTNVFARTIGMSNDPIKALDLLLSSISIRKKHRAGLGNANGRYFLFHVGAGFDAEVVSQVEKRSHLKRYFNNPLFTWATLVTITRYNRGINHKLKITFPRNSEKTEMQGCLAVCLNTDPYTYFGNRPFNVAPELTLDNKLAIVIARTWSAPTMLGVFLSSLSRGNHLRTNRKVLVRGQIDSCTISGKEKFPYQLDGDYLGDVDHLNLMHEPEIIDIFMP